MSCKYLGGLEGGGKGVSISFRDEVLFVHCPVVVCSSHSFLQSLMMCLFRVRRRVLGLTGVHGSGGKGCGLNGISFL